MATQCYHPSHFCCCISQGASALQPSSSSVSKPNQWGRKMKPKPDRPAYELFSRLPRLAGLALRARLAAADRVPLRQTPRDSGSIEMLTERGRRWIKTWMNSQPWRRLAPVERDSNVESHGISLGEGAQNTMSLVRIVFARSPAFHEFKYCTYVVSFPFLPFPLDVVLKGGKTPTCFSRVFLVTKQHKRWGSLFTFFSPFHLMQCKFWKRFLSVLKIPC